MFLTRRLTLLFTVFLPFSVAMASEDIYAPPGNAAHDLQMARERAKASGKLLMVIFGGNWCEDCRVLHARLAESPTREYVEKHFEVVGINIGEMNANLQIAKDLGVTLSKGVPAAGFFDADGKRVALTNNGELEPARQYNAQQVLTFLRKVVEEHVVEKPK